MSAETKGSKGRPAEAKAELERAVQALAETLPTEDEHEEDPPT